MIMSMFNCLHDLNALICMSMIFPCLLNIIKYYFKDRGTETGDDFFKENVFIKY